MDEFQFYRYIDDKSILVITSENKLERLHCPFQVKSKDDGKIIQVESIATGDDWMIFYKVYNMYIQYNCFEIISQ